ncbi:MAG TPA: hypothetical protein VM658_13040 [bacterium]|nr:hypothetical protein [bacterium]
MLKISLDLRAIAAIAILMYCMAPPGLAADTAGQGAEGGSLALTVKPVVIRLGDLPGLAGAPREKLAVMAYKDGIARPVPFQVDPGDGAGYVLGTPERPLTDPTPPGPAGARDELVFMAGDAGERGPAPPEMKNPCAIEARDPITGQSVWAYAGVWTQGPPPRSKEDYVAYQIAPEMEKVVTPHYVQDYGPSELFISDMFILPAAGGDGRDIFDKLKMRSSITAAAGAIKMSFSEEDFVSEIVGVRDGPVRVIRRNKTALKFFLGLTTPSVLVDGMFYRDSYEVPATLQLPFRADLVLSSMTYYQGCDLSLAAGPFTYYADVAPSGVKVDGVMSEQEKALANSAAEHSWGLVTGPAGTLFYQARWQKAGTPTRILPFYDDEKDRQDPPENEPGLAMFGFRLENPLALKNGAYDLNIVNYILPSFQGDAPATAKELAAPLEITIK